MRDSSLRSRMTHPKKRGMPTIVANESELVPSPVARYARDDLSRRERRELAECDCIVANGGKWAASPVARFAQRPFGKAQGRLSPWGRGGKLRAETLSCLLLGGRLLLLEDKWLGEGADFLVGRMLLRL